jgi:hypothetical protein
MTDFSSRVYRLIFGAAAAYNVGFGLWAALFPRAFFELFRLDPPRYPTIWACLGMVVGLYGVAYAYAAWRLDRAFPFIAIGLAGKVLGPIGWMMAIASAELPVRTFPLIVFDDLIWWVPFGLFLLEGTSFLEVVKRNAAFICAALHAVAAIGTIVLLRGGSEAVSDVAQRIVYLGEHPDRWRIGWLLWMFAALSLAGFYAWWGRRVSRRAALFAFALAALGVFCDFAGESIYIGWIPHPGTGLHRAAALLTGAAGNGLYTFAGIALTLARPMPILVRLCAWLTWLSGITLTLFTIAEMPMGIVMSSATLIAFFIAFAAAMGWSAATSDSDRFERP